MKWIMGLGIILSSVVSAQTVKVLTLEEAIGIGEENSKVLHISAAKVDAASARSGEARAAMLPAVKFEGSYRRFSDVEPFQIQPPGFPVPYTVSPTVLNNYSLRATLQQPLFTGFRLVSNARAAEHLAQASEYDNRNDHSDLVLSITASYWMLFQTIQSKKYVDENISRLHADLNDTENLMKAGMATRNDLLRIRVQLSNAELYQIDAANDVQVAAMNLNIVMGLPLETHIQPASVPGTNAGTRHRLPLDSLMSPQGLVMKALSVRPDLQAMQSRVEASRAGVTAARGSWWPQIFLTGNYYHSRPNPRIMPTKDQFISTWDVGLLVQFDVWNWGITLFQAEQAKATLLQNEFLFEQLKDNASFDINRYFLSFKRAQEKISVANLAVEQAEENARTTSDKFKNGLATTSDVLDADVSLLQSRTNLTGALVEYELAQARLAKAAGELH